MDTVFSGLSLIIVIGAAVALIMRLIGQPLIIGHIITGIIVGPAVLHLIKSPDALVLFSDLGIALLLFIIGLGLDARNKPGAFKYQRCILRGMFSVFQYDYYLKNVK
jgi:Kef-type K+ transport system membrane component KefB